MCNSSSHAVSLPPKNINPAIDIPPLDMTGGQCTWCGKYGHKNPGCPLLK
ncbi:hypothetical protein PHYBLDRAFT_146295 [Phycomyces blakesleeanus NRRL 1555(-)]|uniref:CCHC-type zinc finger transcription factor n=1 Tax=Phycomyces blakesleeanus (strain ATCC 8743b / DSM 1359 / FGSC 10004 / NBRC 33097 / NRRL 1555) TaxID=763407 RepID=A0A163AET7_PHYB8|nr:hypothetical protein PHYBLDRAFT_146295 [Phycomyces blakesleeanus NRRL 1555(-)]OAD72981.1 hypothetical protein PHYBLDRAFT_146295 [Phycomyces blakesleeanus NRRL 1555(-)]|eukprot:XP_018291021.1 hypothetical protein PHYBLDRAFT_146295 [Phycomyces blakesleeanus NRRL 1555(-)]